MQRVAAGSPSLYAVDSVVCLGALMAVLIA
jgi:hypothetical protein